MKKAVVFLLAVMQWSLTPAAMLTCNAVHTQRGIFSFPENKELMALLMRIRTHREGSVDIAYELGNQLKIAGFQHEVLALNESANEIALRIYRLPVTIMPEEYFSALTYMNLSSIYFALDPAKAGRAWQTHNARFKGRLGDREFLPFSLLIFMMTERPNFVLSLLKSPLVFKNMIEGKEVPLAVRVETHGKDDWMFDLIAMTDYLAKQEEELIRYPKSKAERPHQLELERLVAQQKATEFLALKAKILEEVDQDRVNFTIDRVTKTVVANISVAIEDGTTRSISVFLPKATPTSLRSYNLFVLRAYLAKVGQDLRKLQASLGN